VACDVDHVVGTIEDEDVAVLIQIASIPGVVIARMLHHTI